MKKTWFCILLALVIPFLLLSGLWSSRVSILLQVSRLGTECIGIWATELGTESIATWATNRIVALGPDALPTLLRALQHEDPKVRLLAASIIGKFEAPSPEATSALVKAAGDRDFEVARIALHLLKNSLRNTEAFNEGLIGALESPLAEVRYLAGEHLRHLGPVAKKAVPALLALKDDSEPLVRIQAAMAVAAIAPDDQAAVDLVAPWLVESLVSEEVNDYQLGLHYLFKLGVRAKKAGPHLMGLFSHPNPYVRCRAAGCFAVVDRESSVGVPVLMELLELQDKGLRYFVFGAFGNTGARASQAIPSIEQYLSQEDAETKCGAALALVRIDPTDDRVRELFPLLVEAFRNKKLELDYSAVRAFAKLAPRFPEGIPFVIEGLSQDIYLSDYFEEFVEAVRQVGEPAFAEMVKVLSQPSEDTWGKRQVLKALGRIGPAAKETIPTIRKLLNDPDQKLRNAATIALDQIENSSNVSEDSSPLQEGPP